MFAAQVVNPRHFLCDIVLTSRYSAGRYAFAVKGFYVGRFVLTSPGTIKKRSFRQGQVRSTFCRARQISHFSASPFPSPKLFVCNLPDSGRHVTRGSGLSTGRWGSLGTKLSLRLIKGFRLFSNKKFKIKITISPKCLLDLNNSNAFFLQYFVTLGPAR